MKHSKECKKKCQHRILYMANLSFINEEETKTKLIKVREYITTRLALEEILTS